jgi:hypothetical protein
MKKYILQDWYGKQFVSSINSQGIINYTSDEKNAMEIICTESTSKSIFRALAIAFRENKPFMCDKGFV